MLFRSEYILASGNPNVMLCERGIRTFETYTRNTMDLSAVPVLHSLSHLPVLVDPSHATGKRWLVKPLAVGGVAVGADGVMVEVHPTPELALSDAEQQLDFAMFADMMAAIVPIHDHVKGLHSDIRRHGTVPVAAGVPLVDYLLYVLQADPENVGTNPEKFTPLAYAAHREAQRQQRAHHDAADEKSRAFHGSPHCGTQATASRVRYESVNRHPE